MIPTTVYIGVMMVVMIIPESRTLKDKRQVIRSLSDRIRQRFDVTCNLAGQGEHPGRQTLMFTSSSQNRETLNTMYDKLRAYLDGFGRAWPSNVHVEVFTWRPGETPMEWNNG